jgi:hypothetical protein
VSRTAAHKAVPFYAKRKGRPRNGFGAAKGSSKREGGIPIDELLAAHAAGRPASATKNTAAPAKPPKTKLKKAPGRRSPRRMMSKGRPGRYAACLLGHARISTDDQTTAL